MAIAAGIALAAVTFAQQAAPPASLAPGSRVTVTRGDGSVYTGTIAAHPANPLWQFITADGRAMNLRLAELTSVRFIGRDATITPNWPTTVRTFPWAEVSTTDGRTVELGVYRWPTLEVTREDTLATIGNDEWTRDLVAIVAVAASPPAMPTLLEVCGVAEGHGHALIHADVLVTNGVMHVWDITDGAGCATLQVPSPGPWTVKVRAQGASRAGSLDLRVDPSSASPLRVMVRAPAR